ncbi:MAG: hypothetical protein H8D67_27165 [Deltaproteobacteria bacterium]|nr:hypothetical protein [Deltaproteobacteria bacterium]
MPQVFSRNKPFSADERRTLIKSLFAAIDEMDSLAEKYNRAEEDKAVSLEKKLDAAHKHVRELYDQYETGLPRPALSRCPFTGIPVHLAIDTYGLDGPWWNYGVPARPIEELPATVFAITGAVNFLDRPPKTNFLCKPGPGVPYVVPRLLVNPQITAVLSTVKIGKYDAYPVFYFAEDIPYDIARINTWGMDHYSAETASGEGYHLHIYDYPIDSDFDLEHYIRSGRLLWIAPGDETLTLNSITGHCPYLGMKGRQYPVGIRDGQMWSCLLDEPETITDRVRMNELGDSHEP